VLVADLTKGERARADGADGLPVREMSPGQRTLLASSVRPAAPWDQVVLRILKWDVPGPESARPFRGIYLMAPGGSTPMCLLDIQPPW